jgi:PAS domain S-box-containing protein
VVGYSTDARRDFVNAGWKQYTGLSDEAALGTDWSIVAYPDDLAIGEKMWRDTLAKGEPVHTEVRLRRADGQYRWFAVDRVALRDESGKVIKWYGTAYDIEQRKRAEQALRESEAKFRDFAETASDWFYEMGPDYKFTLLSENAFGSGAADRIGTAWWDHALDLETEPEKWRLLRATLDSRKPFRDFVYRGKGGHSDADKSGRISGGSIARARHIGILVEMHPGQDRYPRPRRIGQRPESRRRRPGRVMPARKVCQPHRQYRSRTCRCRGDLARTTGPVRAASCIGRATYGGLRSSG